MERKIKPRILRRAWLKLSFIALMALLTPHLFAQITVNVQNKPIKEILKSIEAKSDYRFFYNEGLKGLDKISSLRVSNVGIDAAMTALLQNSEVAYKIEGNNLVALVAKEAEKRGPLRRVSGNVSDSKGVPIIGATVMVKDSKVGTITNYEHDFSLDAEANETFEGSHMG